jgi:ribosomal protein S16
MLTIRFSRIGKKKKPFYRLIISEKTKDTWGTYLEQLGHYDPQTKVAALKTDRIKYWLGVGAQTSNSVHNLLVKEAVIKDDKAKSVFISKNRAAKIEKQTELSDEEVVNILRKQVKELTESIETFKKAGREELVKQNEEQRAIMAAYLPQEISDDELKKELQNLIEQNKALYEQNPKAMMGIAVKNLKKKASPQRIVQLLQTL